jgi:hypothetical protein
MQGDIYIKNNRPNTPGKIMFTTIDAAVAAAEAGETVIVETGDYTLSGAVNITKPIEIVADGLVSITGAPGAAYCFKVTLGVLLHTAEIYMEGFTLNHDASATQKGIVVDNTGATKKINLYLENIEFGTDGGDSIQTIHGDATAAIRIYTEGCTTEGSVNLAIGNAGDRFRFAYGNLRGGLVSNAGAFAAEILIAWSTFLLNGITGGHASQRVIFVASVSETDADPNVYLGAVAADVQTQTPQITLIPGA